MEGANEVANADAVVVAEPVLAGKRDLLIVDKGAIAARFPLAIAILDEVFPLDARNGGVMPADALDPLGRWIGAEHAFRDDDVTVPEPAQDGPVAQERQPLPLLCSGQDEQGRHAIVSSRKQGWRGPEYYSQSHGLWVELQDNSRRKTSAPRRSWDEANTTGDTRRPPALVHSSPAAYADLGLTPLSLQRLLEYRL